jgi:20S proteasome subunit alpha 1
MKKVYFKKINFYDFLLIFFIYNYKYLLGPQVFKIDPSGHFLPYKAVATGKAEPEAMNFLEKKVGEFNSLDTNGTIEMAMTAMQYVLSTDFKSTEIEVGIISNDEKFRILSDEEIEARLTSISENSDL